AEVGIDVVPVTTRRYVGGLVEDGDRRAQRVWQQQLRCRIAGDEGPVSAVVGATGDAQAEVRIRDLAGVQHLQRRVEVVRALHEERTFLGEIQREIAGQVQLRLVGFDLREVRIDGRVDGKVAGRRPGHVQARLEAQAVAAPFPAAR